MASRASRAPPGPCVDALRLLIAMLVVLAPAVAARAPPCRGTSRVSLQEAARRRVGAPSRPQVMGRDELHVDVPGAAARAGDVVSTQIEGRFDICAQSLGVEQGNSSLAAPSRPWRLVGGSADLQAGIPVLPAVSSRPAGPRPMAVATGFIIYQVPFVYAAVGMPPRAGKQPMAVQKVQPARAAAPSCSSFMNSVRSMFGGGASAAEGMHIRLHVLRDAKHEFHAFLSKMRDTCTLAYNLRTVVWNADHASKQSYRVISGCW